MKVEPIPDPLPGERIVDVYPKLKPELEIDARRRLNCFTGRSISDVGFSAEQASRQSHVTTSAHANARGLDAAWKDAGEAPLGSGNFSRATLRPPRGALLDYLGDFEVAFFQMGAEVLGGDT